MNCREFEDIVNDLVRSKIIDAASRAAGMSHIEICGRCASRLADERALSSGLKSLAASDEIKVAPESVETALLAAFRAQSPNTVPRPLPVRSRNLPRWALAAAAAILIAFGFIVYRAVQNEPRRDNDVTKEKSPATRPSIESKERLVKDDRETKTTSEPRATRPRHGSKPRLNRFFIRDGITAYARDTEYTTDFFPLSHGGDQKPLESGELIRVQMPRSALVAFGLPVNIERADVPVKADLLVGEDGLPHAIRFVR
jgi:hypothetical protein